MIKLKFNYKDISKKIFKFLGAYRLVLVSLAVLGVFLFTITRIASYSDPVVNLDRVSQQQSGLKNINFNQEAIDKIRQLRDSGVDIRAKFIDRKNPFAE